MKPAAVLGLCLAVIAMRNTGAGEPAAPAAQALNTLVCALVLPESHGLLLVAAHDPDVPNVAVPYEELLRDAIRFPDPCFSLEPDPQEDDARRRFVSSVSALDRTGTTDALRLWGGTSFVEALVWGPATRGTPEPYARQILDRAGARFRIPPQQLVGLLAWRNDAATVPGPAAAAAAEKVLLGSGDVGAARSVRLGLLVATSEVELAQDPAVIAELGLAEDVARVRAQPAAPETPPDEVLRRIRVVVYRPLLAMFASADTDAEALLRGLASGTDPRQGFDAVLQENAGVLVVNGGRQALGVITKETLQPGLFVPEAVLAEACGASPGSNTLRFIDVAGDTEMGRILFQTDYDFKRVALEPYLRDLVPEHLSSGEWRANGPEAASQGNTDVARRFTILPKRIEIRAPAPWVVEFGRVEMSISTGPASDADPPLDPASEAHEQAYAARLTRLYDAYARHLPALHELKEAMKVLGLVKWLGQRGLEIDAPGPTRSASWSPPARAPALAGAWIVGSAAEAGRGQVVFHQTVGGVHGAHVEEFIWPETRPVPGSDAQVGFEYLENAGTGGKAWAQLEALAGPAPAVPLPPVPQAGEGPTDLVAVPRELAGDADLQKHVREFDKARKEKPQAQADLERVERAYRAAPAAEKPRLLIEKTELEQRVDALGSQMSAAQLNIEERVRTIHLRTGVIPTIKSRVPSLPEK